MSTVCIFGASSNTINPEYIQRGEELGKAIAANGHQLIFGGGSTGLMGAVSRGVQKNGGRIIGVAPTFFETDGIEALNTECDIFIRTKSMRERKQIMEDTADMFIITPGGIGTMEEFFEVLTLKQLDRHNKPIIVLNVNGCYNALQKMLKSMVDDGFMKENTLCTFCDTVDDVTYYL